MTSARCPSQAVVANQIEKENHNGKDLSRLGPGKAQNLKPPLVLRVSSDATSDDGHTPSLDDLPRHIQIMEKTPKLPSFTGK